jgi:hypothetical protein
MEKRVELNERAGPMQPKLPRGPEIPRFYTTEGLTTTSGGLFLAILCVVAR